MKKLFSIIMTLALIFSFSACSKSTSTETTSSTNAPADTSLSSDNSTQNTSSTSSNKILVVYFSATGSTKEVAEEISTTVGADLFEITPSDPYTSEDLDYTDEGSRVNAEHEDESLRDIALSQQTPDNWEQYDTVFIGYPIWWGIAAWPASSFVNGNDFSDKTVIPFCTSASSGMGDSGKLLAEAAGTGNWLDGERFSSGTSSSTVEEWIDSLEL